MSSEPARPRRSRKSIAFQPNASGSSKASGLTPAPDAPAKSSRKARSKSLGPGGLDALTAEEGGKDILKNSNGNVRRTSLAPSISVKSILKPTLPVSPPKEIPAHRPRTQLRRAPIIPPVQPPSIFQPPPPQPTTQATVPLRTEEEQQRRAEILAQRAARRQSLGGRRVSFAPEATLHTWDPDQRGDGDSTPGSSVGGSSRSSTPASSRSNSMADAQATPTPASHELPSTPPGKLEQEPPETPPSTRTEHQKKNRRAPMDRTPAMNFSNPDDDGFMSSSPLSSNAGDESVFVEEEDDGNSDSTDSMDDDLAPGDRTFISVAGETTMGEGDMTRASMDMDLDIDDETARQPMFKKPVQWRFEGEPTEISSEQKAATPPPVPAPALAPTPAADTEDDGEMTMDVTRAGGALLSAPNPAGLMFSFSPKTPQKIEDGGEMTMDITRPLGGLLATRPTAPQAEQEENEDDLMDFTRPVGGILGSMSGAHGKEQPRPVETHDEDMEMTMDMDITRPIGGILSNFASKLKKSIGFGVLQQQQQQQQPPQQQQQQKEDEETDGMDMDITRPIGRIVSAGPSTQNQLRHPSPAPSITSDMDNDEGMTMEFTSVLGGIIDQAPKDNKGWRRSSLGATRRGGGGGVLMSGDQWAKNQQSLVGGREDDDMDMTLAIGGILSAATANIESTVVASESIAYPMLKETIQKATFEQVEYPTLPGVKHEDQEEDFPVQMTADVGQILQSRAAVAAPAQEPNTTGTSTREEPNIEEGSSLGEPTPVEEVPEEKAAPAPASPALAEVTSMRTDSPTPRSKRVTRNSTGASSVTITPRITRGAHRKSLELQKPGSAPVGASPAKIATPQEPLPEEQTTPVQTRPVRKTKTPQQKPATPQAKAVPPQAKAVAPPKPVNPPPSELSAKPESAEKPRTPRKRTPGLSNPHAAAAPLPLWSQGTPVRTPLRSLGFDKPGLGSPAISEKLSRRRSIGEDALTFSPIALPSKLIETSRQDAEKRERRETEAKRLREEEEKTLDLMSKIQLLTPKKRSGGISFAPGPLKRALENAEESGKKRRKSTDGANLIADDDDDGTEIGLHETFSPLPRSMGMVTPKKATPQKAQMTAPSTSNLPQHPPQIRAVKFGDDQTMEEVDQATCEREDEEDEDDEYENISLQEFLQTIDVSFLDDLKATKRRHTGWFVSAKNRLGDGEEASLADRIKAGACTAPMLDAFQHYCRELEKYIEEGRDVISEIETMVQEDNPTLFQEYLNAPADIRRDMDNQFKNIKTHSRLKAKQDWYVWRRGILQGVEAVLKTNLGGLKDDEQFIEKQKQALGLLLPEIKQSWEKARYELQKLDDMKQRIGMDDQQALLAARSRLGAITEKIEETRAQTSEKRQKAEAIAATITEKEAKKADLVASIEEAERIKEMNRGWSENEVNTWRTRCQELEEKSGWRISKALADGRLEMLFMCEVRLLCDPEGNVAPVAEYVRPVSQRPNDRKPIPELEAGFFINGLNAVLSTLRDPKMILQKVAAYWKSALGVVDNVRRLRSHHHTEVHVAEDGNLNVKASVLVQELRSKLEVSFIIGRSNLAYQGAGVRVVYGAIQQKAVQDVLMGWAGEWREGVSEVVERCLEGKRRGGVVVGVRG